MSMHSDVLPKEYCEELLRLQTSVTPCDFEVIKKQIETSFGKNINEIFAEIDKTPLGSASVAQVHRGVLVSGEEVVVKVQKPDIYETMARDIALLKKATKFLYVPYLRGTVDIRMVIDELWEVTIEELNFFTEASNIEEFREKNKGIKYVDVPKLYNEYLSNQVLMMEYVKGTSISDKEELIKNGYDLDEIGRKLVENYVKQFIDDGFFHADPHAGNVKVRDGKIVWIDMGMMGRLSERDRYIISEGIKGIALDDIGLIERAVLSIGEYD